MARAWIRLSNLAGRNLILEPEESNDREDFYISYNPDTRGIDFMRGDEPLETAIVKDDKYYILNGDFRAEYEEVIDKGFDACLRVYKAHKDKYDSSWTTGVSEELGS